MFGANKKKKAAEEAAAQEGGKKKKLTKKEKEKAERELRANLPTRGEVGRKGVFEMHGPLQYTFAVGQIPGGPFYPVDVIIKGHMLYLFEAGEAMYAVGKGTHEAATATGRRPSPAASS